jgi:hypothetical protein
VLACGQPYVGRSVQLLMRRQPDQPPSECWFDFVYQPLFDDSGMPCGVAVVAFDVTELANRQARGGIGQPRQG